jgi:hypothetical protein
MATKKFPSELSLRTPVLTTDKLLVHNITTGATEYTTVALLLAAGGTKYWSCPGIHFDAENPNSDDILKYRTGIFKGQGGSLRISAAVFLPNGATITGATVYGNAAAEDSTWTLNRLTLSDKTNTSMASANVNTEDTSILYSTVDNSSYTYFLYVSFILTDDEIYGASISYTL